MNNETPDNYYGSRRELLPLLPQPPGRLLDIGCGPGYFGANCKQNGATEVVGIEIRPDQAEAARQYLDRVICGDIEIIDLPFEQAYFDTIVCADVLEHLVDPWGTLRRLADKLKPGGCVLASVPNVAHYDVWLNILLGSWTYTDAGLLDRTHLRFFTLREILVLFAQAGLRLDNMMMVLQNPADNPKINDANTIKVREAVKTLASVFSSSIDSARVDSLDLRWLFAYQYHVRALKDAV